MKITIEIDTSNAAFENPSELFNTMRRLSMVFHDHEWVRDLIDGFGVHHTAVVDRNGNTIGRMTCDPRGKR